LREAAKGIDISKKFIVPDRIEVIVIEKSA